MDGIALPLGLTALFVAINGFFVAAEFALVKARKSRIAMLAAKGNRRARTAAHILDHLDLYLSGCQLGITAASLILGWLAEPAVARLLLLLAGYLSITADPEVLHGVALAIALMVVTMLHMVFGEQAPKIWAIHTTNTTTLAVAVPLRVFVTALRPLIWVVNVLSNLVLRGVGIRTGISEEATHDIAEIKSIVAGSAHAGYLTLRQGEFAQNILSLVDLQVRHILVPRVDVTQLSLKEPHAENQRRLRESKHSRLPLCADGLDSVLGVVHTKDVLSALLSGKDLDLEDLVRPAEFVPETMPLSRFIVEMQTSRNGCAVVVDEHGTAVGLAFLDDALEEIVGPIADEFDDPREKGPESPEPGVFLLPGDLPLPEARDLLALEDLEGADTIGGFVVVLLKRLPHQGDTVTFGSYEASVEAVSRHRVTLLRVSAVTQGGDDEESGDPPEQD